MNANVTAIINELNASGYKAFYGEFEAIGYKRHYVVEVHGTYSAEKIYNALQQTIDLDKISYDPWADCLQIDVSELVR